MKMRRCSSVVFLIIAVQLGCSTTNTIPSPDRTTYTTGEMYCNALSVKAQKLSFNSNLGGWTIALLGGAAATTGILIGADLESGDVSKRWVAPSLIVSGALLGAISSRLISRADDATTLASSATLALKNSATTASDELDRLAYNQCIEARAAWLSGRTDHSALDNVTAEIELQNAIRQQAMLYQMQLNTNLLFRQTFFLDPLRPQRSVDRPAAVPPPENGPAEREE